ncbi:MAG: hypothetical protein ACI97A_000651 [Planctomycetota bacterium]
MSFIDADGRELIKGALGSVISKLEETRRPRARRILAQCFLPSPDQDLVSTHVKIELTERGLTLLMGAWIRVPGGFQHDALIVRREGLTNKKLLLTVIAEMINCKLSETEWGYAMVKR